MSSSHTSVAILGAGRSGLAAAALACDLGLPVRVYETGKLSAENLLRVKEVLAQMGAELIDQVPAVVEESLAVFSPGLDPQTELARAFLHSEAECIGELEFAYRQTQTPVIAVTGTNGKTTTVEMIQHLLESVGIASALGGNHGCPLSELVLEQRRGASQWQWLVLEVSSFQLERAPSFAPRVAVWTNFAADHLDRYQSLEEYRQAKLKLLQNLDVGDRLVAPVDMDLPLKAEVARVSFGQSKEADFALQGRELLLRGEVLAQLKDWQVTGRHNFLNALSALAAAEMAGIDPKEGVYYLQRFEAAKHRYEKLAIITDIEYINDSKATNLHALQSALLADEQPVHLLAGGSDKGLDWETMHEVLPGRVERVYAFGEIAPVLAKAWGQQLAVEVFTTMDEAFLAASKNAQSGHQVLLSPGTASFDQFSNYVQRGEHFAKLVRSLQLAQN